MVMTIADNDKKFGFFWLPSDINGWVDSEKKPKKNFFLRFFDKLHIFMYFFLNLNIKQIIIETLHDK